MNDLNTFSAIIFDHDGTLIDTESRDFAACQDLFAEYGLELDLAYWANLIVGRFDGYDILLADLLRRDASLTRDQLWQRLRELWRLKLENMTLMPGVETVVPALHQAGYPLAVATASDRNWAKRWLGRFALLPYFRVIATSDDVTQNKPAPDVYLHAARQLATPPERCLVFEDTLAGVEAATAAGMTVVAVPNSVTRTLDFSQAHYQIESLAEVTLDWIAGLSAAGR